MSSLIPLAKLLRDLFLGVESDILPSFAVLCLCELVGVNVPVHVLLPSPNVNFASMVLSAAVFVGNLFDGTVIPMSEDTIR